MLDKEKTLSNGGVKNKRPLNDWLYLIIKQNVQK